MDHTASRPIKYTYYGHAPRGKTKPVVKVCRGSSIKEVNANVVRWMTQKNKHEAIVAEVIDETYGELLLVATYFPGEMFKIMFKRDVRRPVCVTDFEDFEHA